MSDYHRPVWFLVLILAVSVIFFTLLSLHSSPRPAVQVNPTTPAWATINGVPVNPQHPLGGK